MCIRDSQQGEYAYMATAEAMRNAGMDEAFLAANEVGIIYGNDSSAAPDVYKRQELRNPAPLLQIRLLAERNFGLSMAVLTLFAIGMLGGTYLLPVSYTHLDVYKRQRRGRCSRR